MKHTITVVATIAALAFSSIASAATPMLKPIPSPDQSVRFDKGTPTIETDLANSAVKVVPLRDMDHGSYQFMVAVVNKNLSQSGNFGVENITVTRANGVNVGVYSREVLEKRAKSRAMWSQIGMAMLAGAAAGAQSNNTYVHSYTPYGRYTTVINRPGLSNGQIATIGAGTAGIVLSQIRLEKTLEALGNEILQTTTIDPDGSYGGRVIIGKLGKMAPGETVTIDVEFNGEHHQFGFEPTK